MTARWRARQRLDERLLGLGVRIGPRPPYGWIRTIRDALGMSTFELAGRMGISPRRVSQIERAERDGSMRMATLRRAATSLNCDLCYVLVPKEPLEAMVYRQALEKAKAAVVSGGADSADTRRDDGSPLSEAIAEEIEEAADQLIDRRGLWTTDRRADARPEREGSDQS